MRCREDWSCLSEAPALRDELGGDRRRRPAVGGQFLSSAALWSCLLTHVDDCDGTDGRRTPLPAMGALRTMTRPGVAPAGNRRTAQTVRLQDLIRR
jgi:hypothetical protein